MRFTPKRGNCAILVVILVTFIVLCGCTSYSPPSAVPTTTPLQIPEGPAIMIRNSAFTPPTITVPKGTTVTWQNKDTTNHQVVSDTQGVFTSTSLPGGAGYSFKFENPGTYPYHCSLHPSMKGTVIVT